MEISMGNGLIESWEEPIRMVTLVMTLVPILCSLERINTNGNIGDDTGPNSLQSGKKAQDNAQNGRKTNKSAETNFDTRLRGTEDQLFLDIEVENPPRIPLLVSIPNSNSRLGNWFLR